MNEKTKKLTMMAMMAAIAYLMVLLIHIPVVMFLKYEPKDVIITIGGFIFGPMTACLLSVVVSFIELVTISDTGLWGLLMNILSTVSFACVAAFIYKKMHNIKGAVIGLVAGTLTMTIIMLLWNYFITPIYLGYDRAVVGAMLPTVFLPFNLLKASLNSAFTLLLYKPIVLTLRRTGLLPESQGASNKGKLNLGVMVAAGIVLATCIVLILVWRGII